MQTLIALDRLVERVIRWSAIFSLLAVLALLSLGALVRLMPIFSMSGYDEIIQLLMAWMVFTVAALLWRNGTLFRADVLESILPPIARPWVRFVAQLFMLAFAVMFTWFGWLFAYESTEIAAMFEVSKKFWFASLPFAGLLMTIYSIAGLIRTGISGEGLGAVPSPSDFEAGI